MNQSPSFNQSKAPIINFTEPDKRQIVHNDRLIKINLNGARNAPENALDYKRAPVKVWYLSPQLADGYVVKGGSPPAAIDLLTRQCSLEREYPIHLVMSKNHISYKRKVNLYL